MHFNLQYVRYVISLDIVNVHSWHRGLTLEDHLLPASNHSRVIHNSFVISRIKFADNATRHSHSAISPFFRAEGNLESTNVRSWTTGGRRKGRQRDGNRRALALGRNHNIRRCPPAHTASGTFSLIEMLGRERSINQCSFN